ncbi:carbonic anhydrase [Trichoderma evansii]
MAPTWTELLERNRTYAETQHKPQLLVGQDGFDLPSTLIFACCDFRTSPEMFLNMKGDEAFVIRNLGGRITTSLEAIIFIETFTQGQALKDIVIIHHFDCGCTHNTEDSLKDALKAKHPEHGAEIDKIVFGTYPGKDLEQHKESIRSDINFIRDSPLLREELKKHVYGYVYDFLTGKLVPVAEEN